MTRDARNTGPMRCVKTVLACATALALTTGPANAEEDGVFVDPDSPSGQEYKIPFESARRQADPRRAAPRSVASGADPATLFGEGVISPSAARKGRGSTTSGAGGRSTGEGSRPGADRRPNVVKLAASRPGAPDSGLGMPALFVGIALVVLLVGAGAGFVVRRRAD
jgi:hypothetical protein